MDRWLHVDTLLLILMLKIYVFWYSRQMDWDIDPEGLGNLIGSSR